MLIKTSQIVTLHIYYYRPDYQSLIQEFCWSFDDHVPELYRTHKFLWHWKNNIDAVIKEIILGVNNQSFQHYHTVDEILRIQ
jgi:uncharacterized protein Usg